MKKLPICVFLLDIARFKYSQKTYGFNDLEHCIEVINVTNAYEQEKMDNRD